MLRMELEALVEQNFDPAPFPREAVARWAELVLKIRRELGPVSVPDFAKQWLEF